MWRTLVDVTVDELAQIVTSLRQEGSDTQGVEAKSAAGGFPDSLLPTLSAFANTPGGGVIVLGLNERDGFASVGVSDPSGLKENLANRARQALDPPVTFEVQDITFEGVQILVARIHEQPSHGKPCRVRASGKAYLRAHDGDYQLYQVEEQAFIANRSTPVFDQQPVAGTSAADLRQDLLTSYLASCRATSSALIGMSDEEILFHTGVTYERERELTLAGLLALGTYPQRFVPNCVIQASVVPGDDDPPGTRAADARRFDGPVPLILDDAMAWVKRNTRTRVRFGADGHGRDEPEFPHEAIRELLSNALIHRDLGPHALTQAITLRLERRRLILSNPGGLWGITVDRLGKTGVTSARNGYLLRICQNIRTRDGARVVEALASGIPAVLDSLRRAGMVAPRFHDQGVSFTVTVPNHALLAADDVSWLTTHTSHLDLSDSQRHALVGMLHGQIWTNQSFRETFPMDSRDALRELTGLVEAGLASAEGERRARTYRLAPPLRSSEAAAGAGLATEALDRRLLFGKITEQPPTNTELVLDRLRVGGLPARILSASTGLSPRQVDYALRRLRAQGLVRLVGRQGARDSTYELAGAVGEGGDSTDPPLSTAASDLRE